MNWAGHLTAARLLVRPKVRQKIGAAAFVVIAAVGVGLWLTRGGGAVPVAATTAVVQRGTVTAAVSAAGTVQSSQTRELSFGSTGTVTELNVRAGDLVTTGQVLARIDPADAQAAVDSASNRVNDATDALTKAEQTAALPTCASTTTNPATTNLATTNPATTNPATTSPAATTSAAATGAPRGNNTASAAPCNSRVSTSDGVLAAQQQLNNAQLSLTQANSRLAGTVITSPVDGRVLSVGGTVGSRVSPGGTGFVVLGDVSSLTVRAEFTEADVGRLAIGQVAAITLPGRLDPVSGKVAQIDPAGTVTNRLVRYGVVIGFDSLPADVLLGQSATVLVTTESVDDVLYIASAALVPTGDGVGTATVQVSGRAEPRTVRFGLRGDQYTQVIDGLVEGDTVLLPGSP